MPEQDIAIHVRDLVVGFGKNTVIDHLSLDVRAGEIIGLSAPPAAANRC